MNPSNPPRMNVRLLSMKLSLRHASELLATVIAFHRLRYLSILQCRGIDVRICLRIGDFLERLVLVGLQPLECTLNCMQVSTSSMLLKVKYVRPPVFLTAISARTFSNPISKSCSKSEGAIFIDSCVVMGKVVGICWKRWLVGALWKMFCLI